MFLEVLSLRQVLEKRELESLSEGLQKYRDSWYL